MRTSGWRGAHVCFPSRFLPEITGSLLDYGPKLVVSSHFQYRMILIFKWLSCLKESRSNMLRGTGRFDFYISSTESLFSCKWDRIRIHTLASHFHQNIFLAQKQNKMSPLTIQKGIPQTLFQDWWVENRFKQHYEVMFTSNFSPTFCAHSELYFIHLLTWDRISAVIVGYSRSLSCQSHRTVTSLAWGNNFPSTKRRRHQLFFFHSVPTSHFWIGLAQAEGCKLIQSNKSETLF